LLFSLYEYICKMLKFVQQIIKKLGASTGQGTRMEYVEEVSDSNSSFTCVNIHITNITITIIKIIV
jgi:hypothetical protein